MDQHHTAREEEGNNTSLLAANAVHITTRRDWWIRNDHPDLSEKTIYFSLIGPDLFSFSLSQIYLFFSSSSLRRGTSARVGRGALGWLPLQDMLKSTLEMVMSFFIQK
jgi:hypothetical protein